MRLYQIGIIALTIRHYRPNERKGKSDYNSTYLETNIWRLLSRYVNETSCSVYFRCYVKGLASAYRNCQGAVWLVPLNLLYFVTHSGR
jgi:hypothetical protein